MARPTSPNPKDALLTVRLTAAELAEVHRRAAEAGVSASELARRLLLDGWHREGKGNRKKCKP